MTVVDVIKVIEDFAPLEIQESWDNSGLCIGNPNQNVNSVLIGLDCTIELLEEAKEIGSNLIITHHPIIFTGIKKIVSGNRIAEMISFAIKNDIAVYSGHTNVDKVIEGVSGLMASRIGLINISVLDDSGLGIIGDLVDSIEPEEFLLKLKKDFSLKTLRSSKPILKQIRKVALCGGSGRSLIDIAKNRGADVYITGDISYHDFFCEKNFMLVDIGHYESEIEILSLFFSLLRKKIPNFVGYISEKSNNPIFHY